MSKASRGERAAGALIGSIVGDALGAPFEFQGAGLYSRTFPEPALLDSGEMAGGSGWEPAEWTDDSQMAILLAQSLLERAGVDEADIFDRFQRWARAGAKDVGIQTRDVLTSGLPWDEAAAAHFARTGHAAGNGSLMRTVPAAVMFASAGRDATAEVARRISDLTHGDPAAGDGCAVYHELIRVALDGDDPLEAIGDALALVPQARRGEYEQRLGPDYDPVNDPISNGAVWPALAAAVWSLRRAQSFAEAMRLVIDLGKDTDTVACIAGGLVGAVHSVGAIPSRWTTYLHGQLIGRGDSGIGLDDLHTLARSLLAGRLVTAPAPPDEHSVGPTLVGNDKPVYAASLPGVAAAHVAGTVPEGALIISLSRAAALVDYRPRRSVFMVDQDGPDRNLALPSVLNDVVSTMQAALAADRAVVIHCHGGRSRTGLVLRAWLMAEHPGMTTTKVTAEARRRWPHINEWNRRFNDALEGFGT